MKTKQGVKKVNISMPRELYDYIERAVEIHNADPANTHCPTDRSKMIQKAIREMQEDQRRSGQAMPDCILNDPTPPLPHHGGSARIVVPSSETSGGGSSTRRKVNYRTVGKAK